MENESLSIAAKDDTTLVVPRDVAKQSKMLANLLASTDETRQKGPIRLSQQFEASTLNIVFEWCDEHSGADTTHKDFSMPVKFDNRYAQLKMTPWQAQFFDRHHAHWWELAVAASFLDVPYLYFSTCFVISESLRARERDEEVPESVFDDVLCDVLRFFSHKHINKRGPLQPRWERVTGRAMPLQVVRADIEGGKIEVSTKDDGSYDGQTKEVVDDLESLRCHAVDKRYAFRYLVVCGFDENECAMVQAFLGQPSARLRVQILGVYGFSTKSREAFRTWMNTLKELAKRLDFLESVRLRGLCDTEVKWLVEEPDLLAFPPCVETLNIDVDDESFTGFAGFVEALFALWNRSLRIDFYGNMSSDDLLPLLTKVYEKFDSDAEISVLRIDARVPHSGQMLPSLQQFAASRGFRGTTTDSECKYEKKKRGNDWKMAFDYMFESITIDIKKDE